MEKQLKMKSTREDKIFDVLNYIILGAAMLIVAFPLYFILIASFSDPMATARGEVLLWPVSPSLDGYQRIFENKDIWTGYRNTFIYTILGTTLSVFITMAVAYPLSRKYFSGQKFLMGYFMFTMFFNGGMIPEYLLVKNLKLRDTITIMVILGAVNVFNVIIARTFLMSNIPTELEEAASIDGCSQLRFFFQIVLPLSGSIIAVLVMYYGVSQWNDYFRGMIYLDSSDKYPLQLVIRSILFQSQVEALDETLMETMNTRLRIAELVKYGVIIVSSLPVLVLYPFLQKHFTKGVMIGSVKG